MTMRTNLIQQDGRLIIANSQDCTPIAEQAKALHNGGAHGSSEMKHAARIPQVLVEKYCNDNAITFQTFMNDPAHIKRMLNDPANDAFRIWKGRV